MNPSTARALDRVMRAMSRPPRRRRSGFSMAPIALALGLVIGYQLLARFVPMTWDAMLPGGLEQARFFRGWPGLVWGLSVRSHRDFATVAGTLAALGVAGFAVSVLARPLRPIVWLAALATVAADAGIVYVTLHTAYGVTMHAAGLS